MLIKLILNDADFEKSLKRRKLAAFLPLLGVMALYAVSFLVMSSVLEKRM